MSTKLSYRQYPQHINTTDDSDYSSTYGDGKFEHLGFMSGPPDHRRISWPNRARRIPRAKRLDELDEEI